MRSIEQRHFQWPWTTHNPDFKVTPLFDAEYLTNGTTYRHSYKRILIWIYTCTLYSKVSFRMTLSDLEWLSKIFNDTKHRAVSLQQLSFLSKKISAEVFPTAPKRVTTKEVLCRRGRVWPPTIWLCYNFAACTYVHPDCESLSVAEPRDHFLSPFSSAPAIARRRLLWGLVPRPSYGILCQLGYDLNTLT